MKPIITTTPITAAPEDLSALIPVDEQGRVSGRALHAFLQVKTQYNRWFRRRAVKRGYAEGTDFWTTAGDHLVSLPLARALCKGRHNAHHQQALKYIDERTAAPAPSTEAKTTSVDEAGAPHTEITRATVSSPDTFPAHDELSKLIDKHGRVDGRKLHAFLQVKAAYTEWFRYLVDRRFFREDLDFWAKSGRSDRGRPLVNHALTLGAAMTASLMRRTDRGKLAGQYFADQRRRLMAEASLRGGAPSTEITRTSATSGGPPVSSSAALHTVDDAPLPRIDEHGHVDGRALHAYLQLTIQYNRWIPSMYSRGFRDGLDYWTFSSKGPFGRQRVEHTLTVAMAMAISQTRRTERGARAWRYFDEYVRARSMGVSPSRVSGADATDEALSTEIIRTPAAEAEALSTEIIRTPAAEAEALSTEIIRTPADEAEALSTEIIRTPAAGYPFPRIGTDDRVDGRELHAFLQVKTAYHVWFARMAECGFSEGTDFWKVHTKVHRAGGAEMPQVQTDHKLTLNMAAHLCLMQHSDRGAQARQFFIDRKKSLRSHADAKLDALAEAVRAQSAQLTNLVSAVQTQSAQTARLLDYVLSREKPDHEPSAT